LQGQRSLLVPSCRLRRSVKHKFFPFIPLYYYPHFIVMDSDNVQPFRAKLENSGIALMEEDYLLGNYPKELLSVSVPPWQDKHPLSLQDASFQLA
jgi:hypothetical protein